MGRTKSNHTWVLGINPGPHDGSAALLCNGSPVVMAEQERFSRNKYAPWEAPVDATAFCLAHAGIDLSQISSIGVANDIDAYIDWLGLSETERSQFERLDNRHRLLPECRFGTGGVDFLPVRHHLAHAWSAFRGSGYDDAAILVMDDRGEDCSTTLWHGTPDGLTELATLPIEQSLGVYYRSAATYAGFDGEFGGAGKFMGLASYGQPTEPAGLRSVDGRPHFDALGSSALPRADLLRCLENKHLDYFAQECFPFVCGLSADIMAYANFAASVQLCLENVVMAFCKELKERTLSDNLALAGGVALNCTLNGRIAESGLFHSVWVQPAASDSGTALGAAYAADWHLRRDVDPQEGVLRHAYLGPDTDPERVESVVRRLGLEAEPCDEKSLIEECAKVLARRGIIGWYQGRAEIGPRALGARSMLGNPAHRETLVRLNSMKSREMWRPIAPSILEEHYDDFFTGSPSPYMTAVAHVKRHQQSRIPAVVHVDRSARPQVVSRSSNLLFWSLLTAFHSLTGIPLLANTSFNLRGEPIVNTPEQAIADFLRSNMDALAIGPILLRKPSNSVVDRGPAL
jgi:carbamoyltransferase